MRISWPATQYALPREQPERPVHTHVLLETEAPELVLAETPGRLWIGVVSEVVEGEVHWLYAPITTIERTAILTGVADLHDCFLKPEVMLVAESESQVRCVMTSEVIDDNALPTAGAVLPEWARPPLDGLSPARPTLAIARTDGRVLMKAVAAICDNVQRLYYALAQHLIDGVTTASGAVSELVRESAEIELVQASHGSLLIDLRPADDGVFADSTEIFSRLLSTKDTHELHAMLKTMGPRVQGRYEDLLKALATTDSSLMIASERSAAFIGGHAATSRIELLPAAPPDEPVTMFARGRLIGLDPEGTFTFLNFRDHESIKGQAAETFQAPSNIKLGMVVMIEYDKKVIRDRSGRISERYELLRVITEPIGGGTAPSVPPPAL